MSACGCRYCQFIAGDGIVFTPIPGGYQLSRKDVFLTCDETMDLVGAAVGDGIAYNAGPRTLSVVVDPAAANQMEMRADGLYWSPAAAVVDCPTALACIASILGEGLAYALGSLFVLISNDPGNTLIVGTDSGLWGSNTAVTAPAWTTLPAGSYLAPFTPHATTPVRYRKWPDGWVQWDGKAARTGAETTNPLISVPLDVRPVAAWFTARFPASIAPVTVDARPTIEVSGAGGQFSITGNNVTVASLTEVSFHNLEYGTVDAVLP